MKPAPARFVVLSVLLLATPLAAGAQATGKVQTTNEANRENLKGAAEAPLRDLNVMRTQIPEVLLLAAADPYRRPKNAKCATLVAEILPLDEALGSDLDAPSEDQASLKDKGRGRALGMVAGAASDIIPFRSLVRKASGAEQHDRAVQDAITAGLVRRAYLKGLGESKGCQPPATPSHVRAGTPVLEAGRPRYPVR